MCFVLLCVFSSSVSAPHPLPACHTECQSRRHVPVFTRPRSCPPSLLSTLRSPLICSFSLSFFSGPASSFQRALPSGCRRPQYYFPPMYGNRTPKFLRLVPLFSVFPSLLPCVHLIVRCRRSYRPALLACGFSENEEFCVGGHGQNSVYTSFRRFSVLRHVLRYTSYFFHFCSPCVLLSYRGLRPKDT